MNELMIDIETLDTANTAIVFQIACIVRNDTGEDVHSLQWNVDAEGQMAMGRTVSISTIQFWLNPEISRAAYESMGAAQINTTAALHQLSSLVRQYSCKQFWAKGSFDFDILNNMYAGINMHPPWKYYQCRDLRTLMKECNVSKQASVSHNALDDCKHQWDQLDECRKRISRG